MSPRSCSKRIRIFSFYFFALGRFLVAVGNLLDGSCRAFYVKPEFASCHSSPVDSLPRSFEIQYQPVFRRRIRTDSQDRPRRHRIRPQKCPRHHVTCQRSRQHAGLLISTTPASSPPQLMCRVLATSVKQRPPGNGLGKAS